MIRSRRHFLLILLAISASFAPRVAFAAPFCTQVSGMAPQCLYFDPAECRERAHQLSGTCTANPDELKIVPGNARYCLVTATHAGLCIYQDLQSCDSVAEKDGAVCIDNGSLQANQNPLRGGLPGAGQDALHNGAAQPEEDPFRAGEPERRY